VGQVLRDPGQAVRGMGILLKDARGAPEAIADLPIASCHHHQEGVECRGWRTRGVQAGRTDSGTVKILG
jgi:hypothetical protein